MRIISGKNKAKRLNSPKTELTRPTLDRVKEALFSILEPNMKGSKILDLFSGTGNLGLEAISRGADFAWLNDSNQVAISTIISNTLLTNSKDYVKITKKDYRKCLNQIIKDEVTFDIIFLDPPYDSKFAIETLNFISENKGKILNSGGIIIYETDKNFFLKISKTNDKALDSFENLEMIDNRSYGNVLIFMYKWR